MPPIDVYMLLWHGSGIVGTRNGWILWLRDQLHGWDEWNLSTLVFKVKVLVEEGLVHESGTWGGKISQFFLAVILDKDAGPRLVLVGHLHGRNQLDFSRQATLSPRIRCWWGCLAGSPLLGVDLVW